MKARNVALVLIGLVLVLVAVVTKLTFQPKKDMADPASWKDAYPLQYASYEKNSLEIPQPYGGSVPKSRFEAYPEAQVFYAGVGFAKEYNAARGHVYSLKDVKEISRPKSSAVCLSCKTSDLPRLQKEYGEEGFYKASFDEVAAKTKYPISCANCHDPAGMDRIIVNPALKAGLASMGVDTASLSADDMKMLSCAQCHVEYYFKKDEGNKLTFPWFDGLDPRSIEAYYENIGFTDWVHEISGIPLLKVQHPEFETFSGSLHNQMGLACADCHMPSMEEAGKTYPSHWWTSPLNHIEASCLGCHGETAEELKDRLLTLQAHTAARLSTIGKALASFHEEVGKKKAAISASDFDTISKLVRSAQFRFDFVFSENSTGYHNNALAMGLLDDAEASLSRAKAVLAGI